MRLRPNPADPHSVPGREGRCGGGSEPWRRAEEPLGEGHAVGRIGAGNRGARV